MALGKKKPLVIVAGALVGIVAIANVNFNGEMKKAEDYISNSEYDKAIEILDSQISINSSQDDIYLNYAECYIAQKQYQKALDILKDGKKEVSDDTKIDDKITEINSTYGSELKAERDAKNKVETARKKDTKNKNEKGTVTSLSTTKRSNTQITTTTTRKITTTKPTTTQTTTTTRITTVTTKNATIIYYLNPESMKIHRSNCRTIKHPENFQETTDFDGAINQGYSRCKVCMR